MSNAVNMRKCNNMTLDGIDNEVGKGVDMFFGSRINRLIVTLIYIIILSD